LPVVGSPLSGGHIIDPTYFTEQVVAIDATLAIFAIDATLATLATRATLAIDATLAIFAIDATLAKVTKRIDHCNVSKVNRVGVNYSILACNPPLSR